MKIRKFRAGDMVESASDSEEDKAKTAGLAASNAEKKSSGFLGLGRLFQGNIDEKGSEAYNKYGAGYGREVEAENDRLKAATRKATAAPAETKPAASAPAAPAAVAKYRGSSDYSDTADMKRNQGSAPETKMERRNLSVPNAAGPSTTPEKGDRGARDTSSFKKTAAPAAAKPTAAAETKMERRNLSVPNAAGPSAPAETKMERRNESVPNAAGPSAPAPAAKAPEAAKPAEKQLSQAQQRAQAAIARATGNSSGVASGRVTAAEAGRNIASVAGKAGDAVSSVGNYFKNFETPAERRSRLAKEAKSSQKAGGGAIRGYASGGSVSAASRGDGIAQRGKTRGKMC